MAARIRKGDNVVVLAGKDRGREGEVLKVLPSAGRAVVRQVNVVRKHRKQSRDEKGGIVSAEASIHLSNLALKDPATGKPVRVGFRFEDGKKVRFARGSGEVIDV